MEETPSDQPPPIDARPPEGRALRWLLLLGSAAMLIAMATDAFAVLGRHAGFALHGSIEIFQMTAAVATSVAIVIATLSHRHAAVHILTDNVAPGTRRALDRAGLVISALAFGAMCVGSLWVSIDLWATQELTEQLGLPLRPFRLVWIGCAAVVTLIFLVRLARSVRR